jgi:hypothetical protein
MTHEIQSNPIQGADPLGGNSSHTPIKMQVPENTHQADTKLLTI